MKHVSLFSGFGGFDLGFQRAGIETVAQCEKDKYCQSVLHKHWPDTPICPDINDFPEFWDSIKKEDEVYVATAGFPCQPFSFAGKKEGIKDHRWLWPQTATALRAIRPKYLVLENVAALVNYPDAFGRVLSDIHEMGFDAEWGVVSAAEFGALHYRNRVIILSYPNSRDGGERYKLVSGRVGPEFNTTAGLPRPTRNSRWKAETSWRASEPRIRRMVNGIPIRILQDRLRGLGNAIVPQAAEYYARFILEIEKTGIL